MQKIFLSTLLLSTLTAGTASAATTTFYANAGTTAQNEITSTFDSPQYLSQGNTQTINIGYDLNPNWNITSASLSLKLADDSCVGGHGTACPDTHNYDFSEIADITKIENQTVNVTGVEVGSYGWYNFAISNLTDFLQLPYSTPFTAILKAETGDFWYKNAKINITYSEVSSVPVPAAAWLFGSGLAGLIMTRRNQKSA